MFSKYLLTLEDPDHPLLGPTLWGLKSTIMCRTEKGKVRIIYSLVYLLAIFQMLSQYIEIYCLRTNMSLALKNLSITIFIHVSVVKIGSFIIWQKDWMKVMYYASSLEKRQLAQEDQVIKNIIKKYTKYSRSFTYFYWVLVATSGIIYSFAPLVYHFFSSHISKSISIEEPYPEIISVWVPFDKTKGFGYWTITITTILLVFYVAISFAMYDCNAVVLMSFFACQLEILSLNSEKLFANGEETIDYQESVRRIQMINHHHVLLLKYSRILKSLLSNPMFVYIIMCSVMMCSSAVYLTTDGVIIAEKLLSAEYLAALVFQLFIYCWHSQQISDLVVTGFHMGILMSLFVGQMSLKVAGGVYSSSWWSQGIRIRRNVLLLAGQLNKDIILTAGPFANLSVATFVAIMKGAYSYYTLLSNMAYKK